MIDLSICVPTYNRADLLRVSLESIRAAMVGYEARVELLVSDNASTDHTAQVVKELIASGIPIRYDRNPVNVVDKNFFVAPSRATGSYVWVFGDDDVMEPDAVAQVLSRLDQSPGLVICNYSVWDREMKVLLKDRNHPYTQDVRIASPQGLMADFGTTLQFITSVVIRKDILFHEPAEAMEPLHEYGVSFMFALYSGMLAASAESLLIARPVLRYRGYNSDLASVEKWYKYFVDGTALVLKRLRARGYSRYAIYRARIKVMRYYILRDVLARKRAGDAPVRLIIRIGSRYADQSLFWLLIIPLILMPRFLFTALERIKPAKGVSR